VQNPGIPLLGSGCPLGSGGSPLRFAHSLWLGVSLVVAMAGGCAVVKPDAADGGGGGGSGGSQGAGSDGPLAAKDRGTPTMPVMCGNGERTADEACDDGNTMGGDGCSADCKTVEPGFSCQPPGKPCHRVARCGDGVVVLPELCDDKNTAPGDGCSATCKVELGWKCSGNPSVCTHTTCSDHVVEGAESCDDGNALPFDGCSQDCQTEPDCKSANGACVSKCGDGIVVGEACDDGNTVDGDGCSATCTVERGFTCAQPPLGNEILVPVVYRDFRYQNPAPDFQPDPSLVMMRTMPLTGIVMQTLDGEGKPVYTGGVANSFIGSQDTFKQWYRDTAGVNHTTASKLALWSNGNGAYVNRWGPNGEQWVLTTTAYYCGHIGEEMIDPATGMGIPCTSKYPPTDCDRAAAMPGYTMLSCFRSPTDMTSWSATFQTGMVDGQPFFFPVDGDNFTPATERHTATTGPPYSGTGYLQEPGTPQPVHNFSFTSEVRYWFLYKAASKYTLDFLGDDDVWLFINKKLAVDLGGIHSPASGSVTFGVGATNNFGMQDGNVYEVEVFQAEREIDGSSYKLTLSGFSSARSECTPICGDGILGIGEECDDGVNAGGYGQCGPGCKLGAYCGDGIVQPDQEDCDDGINVGMPCPSGCRVLIVQ